jgi:hypothetical protein
MQSMIRIVGLSATLPTYLEVCYLQYHAALPEIQLIILWYFAFFRLHNFCELMRILAFSTLTQVTVQFPSLNSTSGSLKGITPREMNYSIVFAMRRSLFFFIYSFIWILSFIQISLTLYQIFRLWSPLSKVIKHWFLFIPARIQGKLLGPW